MDEKKHNKKCRRCGEYFVWFNEEARWDYRGYSPTKLVDCPYCNTTQAVDYESEQNVNFDERYYK